MENDPTNPLTVCQTWLQFASLKRFDLSFAFPGSIVRAPIYVAIPIAL